MMDSDTIRRGMDLNSLSSFSNCFVRHGNVLIHPSRPIDHHDRTATEEL